MKEAKDKKFENPKHISINLNSMPSTESLANDQVSDIEILKMTKKLESQSKLIKHYELNI